MDGITTKSLPLFPKEHGLDSPFNDDATLIDTWACADSMQFMQEARDLTVLQIEVAITKAEDVAREHRAQADRAVDLARRLRELLIDVAHYGEDRPMEATERGAF